ncbi:MAG: NYN domain-containing protein [Planctomycetota bacterium]
MASCSTVTMMVRDQNNPHVAHRSRMAVFLDLDSFATEDGHLPADFDAASLLAELKDRGAVVHARAYADWSEFPRAGEHLGRAGFELIQMFPVRGSGGSSIPVALASDAMATALSHPDIDTIVLVADQVDFCGLARRLRERGLRVAGAGFSSENAALTACYDSFHSSGRLRERGARAWSRRAEEGASGRAEQMRRQACEYVVSTLARLEREGQDAVTGTELLKELRRYDSHFDPASLGFGDLSGLLRAVNAPFELDRSEPERPQPERPPADRLQPDRPQVERCGGELVVSTHLRHEEEAAVEGASIPASTEEYQSLLARLQLRVTPIEGRTQVVARIFELVQEALDQGQVITAGEIEADLLGEFGQTGSDELKDAVRDTLRVLFVNRAFRLDSVDDGYESPLTFNKLYIRTAEDLQQYYSEAILCAIKNMVRERGGARPDMRVLAELILGNPDAVSDLETIEAQLQGADRPFKKPPRYSARWTSVSAVAEPRPLSEAAGAPRAARLDE